MTQEDGSLLTRKVVSISILTLIYLFVGLFGDQTLNYPFRPSKPIENIQEIVPILSSILFGKIIGSSVGGIGYISLEIILQIIGERSESLGLSELIHAITSFVTYFITGHLAKRSRIRTDKISKLIFNPHTWLNMLINTFSVIVTVSLLKNGLEALTSYLIGNIAGGIIFLEKFYYSINFIVITIPPLLLLYSIIQVIRNKRIKMLDQLYHQIDIDISGEDGPAKIIDAYFKDHALQIGKWTAISLKFKHTWKAARSYEIETISTSKVYPHLEKTPVLKQNETWEHTIYVQALEQDYVDIKFRLNPSQTKKFKEPPHNLTYVNLSAQTYVKRDVLFIGVIVLGEAIITFFIFSLLWNQFIKVIIQEMIGSNVSNIENNSIQIPWDLIVIVMIIEAILFIPFLIMMYKLQKPNPPSEIGEELAFSQDLHSHNYVEKEKHRSFRDKLGSNLLIPLFGLVIFVMAILGTYDLYVKSRDMLTRNQIHTSLNSLILISLATTVLWLFVILMIKRSRFVFNSSLEIDLGNGLYIDSVVPLTQLQINKSTELLFEVTNISGRKGIRLIFETMDAISPPLIELHLSPGEQGIFKASITPQATGTQEILMVVYPLFDKEGKYVELSDTSPIANQTISYQVLDETIVGITQSQARNLRHLFGWGSLLTSTFAIANQYIEFDTAIQQWRQTIPFIASVQLPFLYLYYLFSNKFMTTISTH